MFIYAPKKHFKSMMLFNILYDIAEGTPIMGKWDVSGGPKQVLLIEQELGKFRMRGRFERLHVYRNGMVASENIAVVSKQRAVKLDTPEGYHELAGIVGHYRPQVVALDPIRKFHRQDENDSTAITRVVDSMDRLIEEFGVTLIIAHHQGHESQFNTGHMRGSSVWGDEADTIIKLSRPVPNNKSVIRVTVEELRDAAVPPPFDVQYDEQTNTFIGREHGTGRVVA